MRPHHVDEYVDGFMQSLTMYHRCTRACARILAPLVFIFMPLMSATLIICMPVLAIYSCISVCCEDRKVRRDLRNTERKRYERVKQWDRINTGRAKDDDAILF